MVAENMDGDVSEFDMEHFCDGNPVYCYYFRLRALQESVDLPEERVSLEVLPSDVPVLLSKVLIKDVSLKTEKEPLRE